MPTDSNRAKYVRRLKRERSYWKRMFEFALRQREEARLVAVGLEQELKKYQPEEPAPMDNFFPEGDDPTPIVASEDKQKELQAATETVTGHPIPQAGPSGGLNYASGEGVIDVE